MVPEAAPICRVLVVDDSRAQRRVLTSMLGRWGYEVAEAGSGAAALDYCLEHSVDIILSDWMMPGMTGLEFCQAFRVMQRDSYGYFILLTSKSEKGEVAHGLDVGADDFLTKPVAANELRARLQAGGRVLAMERELNQKNRLVNDTLTELRGLYDSLDRDLQEARNLQQSLVRETFIDLGAARISLMLKPCGHVGGDLVGTFPIDADTVGFYSIDVSGHGIASALMTARLAAYLSGNSADRNIALKALKHGAVAPNDPADVAAKLNHMMLNEMETEHYFTLVLGHLSLPTGRVVMSQCGHPHPVVQREDGEIEFTGAGGLPIGLLEDASWESHELTLSPGDRLMIYSDGISECTDPAGQMLDDDGLSRLLRRNARLRARSFLETLVWDLTTFAGDQEFDDDVSAILLEYPGPT